MRRCLWLLLAGLMFIAGSVPAQESEPAAHDALLDRLTGQWRMTGHVQNEPVEYKATAEWILGGQFLRLHLIDVSPHPQYEASVHIGLDATDSRYVCHWLDVFGAHSSETIGHAPMQEDVLDFSFAYPEGPFQTTFTARPDGSWHVLMRTRGDDSEWGTFAEYTMKKAP